MPTAPEAASRLESLDSVIEALSHPARRQILMTIHFRRGRMTSGEVAGRFAHSWPTTTRHLSVLAATGLLKTRKEGRERIYTIDTAGLEMLRQWLDWFFADKEGPSA